MGNGKHKDLDETFSQDSDRNRLQLAKDLPIQGLRRTDRACEKSSLSNSKNMS